MTGGTVEDGNVVALWTGLVGNDAEGAETTLGVGDDGTEAVVATGGGAGADIGAAVGTGAGGGSCVGS